MSCNASPAGRVAPKHDIVRDQLTSEYYDSTPDSQEAPLLIWFNFNSNTDK